MGFDDLPLVLGEQRVRNALHLSLRDLAIRRRFAVARAEGVRIEEALEGLTGPYEDARGRTYYLSVERIRAIIYRRVTARPSPRAATRVQET